MVKTNQIYLNDLSSDSLNSLKGLKESIMLDGFLPELEMVDVNHCDKANQFICHGKKSCVYCPCCTQCSCRVHKRCIST